MKLFISYTHTNQLTALRIKQMITDDGYHEVWMDAKDIRLLDNIEETIESGFKNVDLVILVWSKEAFQSKGVADEMEYCLQNKIPVLPCLLDNTPPPLLNAGKFGLLSVSFLNKDAGLFDLRSFLLLKEANKRGVEMEGNLIENPEFSAFLKNFTNHTKRGTTKGTDAIFAVQQLFRYVPATTLSERPGVSGYKSYVNGLLERLRQAVVAKDETAIDSIRKEFDKSPYTGEGTANMIRFLINQMAEEISGTATVNPVLQEKLNRLQKLYDRFTTLSDHSAEHCYENFCRFYTNMGWSECRDEENIGLVEGLIAHTAYAPLKLRNLMEALNTGILNNRFTELSQLYDLLFARAGHGQDALEECQDIAKAIYEAAEQLYARREIAENYNSYPDYTEFLKLLFTRRETEKAEFGKTNPLFGSAKPGSIEEIFAMQVLKQALFNQRFPPSAWDLTNENQLQLFQANAAKSVAESMYQLGATSEFGLFGQISNTVLSILWYQKAANTGFRPAVAKLYDCYSRGYMTGKDEGTAKKWLEKLK